MISKPQMLVELRRLPERRSDSQRRRVWREEMRVFEVSQGSRSIIFLLLILFDFVLII